MSKVFHILGAGISSLSLSKYLRKKYPDSDIIIYEASHRLGGRAFSYYDSNLQTEIDNATHVILGANRHIKNLFSDTPFEKGIVCNPLEYKDEIGLSIFNTPLSEVPLKSLLTLGYKLFPFLPAQTKSYFTKNNISSNLLIPLSKYATKINYGWKLREAEFCNHKLTSLIFNKGVVEAENDTVISGLDAFNYSHIFGGAEFDFNAITNIFYRTSQPITLPHNKKMLALKGQLSQWIFINNHTLSVTISRSQNLHLKDEDLARTIWKEINLVRDRQSPFLPPYRVLHYPRATISQNTKNNNLRPKKCTTEAKNFFIMGDWTMQNYPCSLETAVLSAKRVLRKL